MRAAVKRLIESTGLPVQAFTTAREFLELETPGHPGLSYPRCLPARVDRVGLAAGTDRRRPSPSGNLPYRVTAISPMTVQALKAGAVEFLTKPFRIKSCCRPSGRPSSEFTARQQRAKLAQLRERYDRLTAREHDVLELVVSGMLNKQIQRKTGTSEVTVKRHRGQMMEKMQAKSVADFVRMTDKLGISPLPGRASDAPANRAQVATAGMSRS